MDKEVIIFGNTNNVHLNIAKILLDSGYRANVIGDFKANDPYNIFSDWYGLDERVVVQDPRLNEDMYFFDKFHLKQILEPLTKDKFVIVSSWWPAIFHLAGVKFDMFLAMGNDALTMPVNSKGWKFSLFYPPFTVNALLKNPKKIMKYLSLSKHQRAGIEASKYRATENWHYVASVFDRNKWDLVLTNQPVYPIVSADEFCRIVTNNDSFGQRIRANLECDRLFILSSKHDFSYKGTHELLKIFNELCNATNLNYKLITFDVGPKREEFRSLVEELELQDRVLILPFVARSQLLSLIASSDLVFGNYSDIDAHLNGSLSFALALGKPLITSKKCFTGTDTYNCILLDDYCSETSPPGIVQLIDDKERLSVLGRQGAEWYINAREKFIEYLTRALREENIFE